MEGTKINRRQDLLARLAQVNKLGLPYKTESGNGLKGEGAKEPLQILKDGKIEVLAGVSKNYPFIEMHKDYPDTIGGYKFSEKYLGILGITDFEKVYDGANRRVVGIVACSLNSPIEIHAIYDKDTDQTHYFLMPRQKKTKK